MFPYAFRDNFNFLGFAYINLLMKRASRLSDLIFTVSEFSKSEIIKFLNVDDSIVCTVPLGVDPGFHLNAEDIKIDKKYILCVGNIKPHKNIKKAIEAFNRISPIIPDYELVIVGKSDGFYSPEKGFDSILKSNPKVRFTGFVTFEELRKYYSEASMLLFPSLYEGFGLPVLEAMAFNLPIAASSRASIPEVGSDYIVYFDPENVDEIAKAMLGILNGELQCSVHGYGENLAKYTWEGCANKTIEYIKKLA
jgi:glycosyltransferase involved in cell wall biosynthesis